MSDTVVLVFNLLEKGMGFTTLVVRVQISFSLQNPSLTGWGVVLDL